MDINFILITMLFLLWWSGGYRLDRLHARIKALESADRLGEHS